MRLHGTRSTGRTRPVRQRLSRSRRVLAALVVVGLATLSAAAPAQAHGAPTFPVSRTLACSATTPVTGQLPVCQAAIAAGGTQAFAMFDNLRVPNVNGQDRALIPNGRLCSAGLDVYRGLDLARADWPATPLAPGSTVTMQYSAPIQHPGTFSLYLTTAAYNPMQPLTWDVIEQQPFATVTDPPILNGAYQIPMTVPAGRSGRQLIYTIWRTTEVDTYYSCADVELGGTGTMNAFGTPGQVAAPGVPPGANGGLTGAAGPAGGPAPGAAAQPARPAAAGGQVATVTLTGGPYGNVFFVLLAAVVVLSVVGVGLVRFSGRAGRR